MEKLTKSDYYTMRGAMRDFARLAKYERSALGTAENVLYYIQRNMANWEEANALKISLDCIEKAKEMLCL